MSVKHTSLLKNTFNQCFFRELAPYFWLELEQKFYLFRTLHGVMESVYLLLKLLHDYQKKDS